MGKTIPYIFKFYSQLCCKKQSKGCLTDKEVANLLMTQVNSMIGLLVRKWQQTVSTRHYRKQFVHYFKAGLAVPCHVCRK